MAYAQPFPLAQPSQMPAPRVFAPDLAVRLICPDCKDPHPNIVEEYSSGDLVCGSCGLVLGDRIIDERSEWRTFSGDDGDDPCRVGAAVDPFMLGVEQFGTQISFKDNHSGLAQELQRTALRSGTRTQRNLIEGFKEITEICDQFCLPKAVCDIAKQLFKRAADEKVLRAREQRAGMAACIFIACRQARVDRTFKEIAAMAHIEKKALSDNFKRLSQTFKLSVSAPSSPSKMTAPVAPDIAGPEVHLGRVLNQLGLPHNYEPICAEIIRNGRSHSLFDNRQPLTILGTVIYFACHLLGNPKPLSEIKVVVEVSESTMRALYQKLYGQQDKLIRTAWVQQGIAKTERLPIRAY